MSNGQQPAPGWYADPWPSPPDGLRWWDGGQWTSATSVPGQGPTDAGWWRRAGAYLIDGFIVGSISFVVGIPAQVGLQRDLQAEAERLNESVADGAADTAFADYWSAVVEAYLDRWVWLALLPLVAALAYHAVMLRTRSATVGKRALRLRVVPVSGRRAAVVVGRREAAGHAVRTGLADHPGRPRSAGPGPRSRSSASWRPRSSCSTTSGPRRSDRRAIHDLVAGTRVLQDP